MDGANNFDLLTLREVAELLHVSKAHISNAVAGRLPGCTPIPAVHLGRRTLVRRSSLLAWIAANENDPSSPVMLDSSPARGVRKRA
jgi:excisionase family DNA binding protein